MKYFVAAVSLALLASPTFALERIVIANETPEGIQKQVNNMTHEADSAPAENTAIDLTVHGPIKEKIEVTPTTETVTTTKVIPDSLPIIRALVASNQSTVPVLIRDPKNGKLIKWQATQVTYDYLLEGGKHLMLTDKLKKAKDSRSNALQHPELTRNAIKAKRVAAFAAPFINILGSIAQIGTYFHK